MKFIREMGKVAEKTVHISISDVVLEGDLTLPKEPQGLVIFAHGSGSSRRSSRNRAVARTIHDVGLGTLLFDLLTRDEELSDMTTGHLRFNIPFLAKRLNEVAIWATKEPETAVLPAGYFGSSTGGGAALVAAADDPDRCRAVVSRGGRPDLAGAALPAVMAPTLLIVGGRDHEVLKMNEEALEELTCEKELKIIPGATHLFQEMGALEEVAKQAALWFARHLKGG